MIKQGQVPIVLQPRGPAAPPQPGQRVRVTVRSEIELWQGARRLRYRAGEVYEGRVLSAEDGLISLRTDADQLLQIYARDRALAIELLKSE